MLILIICLAATPTPAQAKQISMYSRCVAANSKTGYCLVISKSQHICAVYKKSGRKWKQYASFYVTVGRNGCTRSGTFTTGKKSYYKDFRSSTAFYVVSLKGGASGYLHSTLYRKGSRSINKATYIDNRTGVDASAGCVRFARWNMYWIYTNIPKGTKVVIF